MTKLADPCTRSGKVTSQSKIDSAASAQEKKERKAELRRQKLEEAIQAAQARRRMAGATGDTEGAGSSTAGGGTVPPTPPPANSNTPSGPTAEVDYSKILNRGAILRMAQTGWHKLNMYVLFFIRYKKSMAPLLGLTLTLICMKKKLWLSY